MATRDCSSASKRINCKQEGSGNKLGQLLRAIADSFSQGNYFLWDFQYTRYTLLRAKNKLINLIHQKFGRADMLYTYREYLLR